MVEGNNGFDARVLCLGCRKEKVRVQEAAVQPSAVCAQEGKHAEEFPNRIPWKHKIRKRETRKKWKPNINN